MHNLKLLVGALGMTLLAVTAAQAIESDYAERIYAEFTASTKGQVSVELKVVGAGELRELAGQKVGDLVGVPLYTVNTVNPALGTESAWFDDVDLNSLSLEDLNMDLDQFAVVGLPLSEGTFRQFDVTVTIGKEARTHTAVELCWSAQSHCVVFDPNIEFLDSMVNGQHEGRAQGWFPYAEQAQDMPKLKAQALQAGVVIMLRNNKSGRCIGVDDARPDNGAQLKQFTCVDSASHQHWRVEVRGISHTFVNVKSGKCMGVDRASVNPGANISQYNCSNGAPNQSWEIESDNTTTDGQPANLRDVKSRLCIGVDRGSTHNGAQLKQFGCSLTAPNQEWFIMR